MQNNCVNFTSENPIVIWANHKTDQVIDVQPIIWPPFLTYHEKLITNGNYSLLKYQWCGPLMLIMREFAKRINANMNFGALPRSYDSYFEFLASSNPDTEWPHIGLFPTSPQMSERYIKPMNSKLSRYIGFSEFASISSITKKNDYSPFSFFNCFSYEIYLLILISIIVISLMICLKDGSLQRFFKYIWMYSSVILSDYYSIRINGHFDRSFAGIWLLVCNLLLALFSSFMWEQLVRNKPIDKIDSFDDLYTKPRFKNMSIKALKFMEFHIFVNEDTSPMAQNFKKRTKFIDPLNIYFNIIRTRKLKDLENVFKGEEVLVLDYGFSHYFKYKFKEELNRRVGNEGFDYHISEYGLGRNPYSIIMNSRLNQTLTKELNFVITRLVESGIYEHEVRKAFKPLGFGPDIDTKVDTNAYKFGPLKMNQMKSIFISYGYVLIVSVAVIIIELLTITHWFSFLKSYF